MALLKNVNPTELNEYELIRFHYDVECETLSKILGLGVNQWRQYETGKAKPSRVIESLIQLIKNPFNYLSHLDNIPKKQSALFGEKFERTRRAAQQLVSDCNIQEKGTREKFLQGLYKRA